MAKLNRENHVALQCNNRLAERLYSMFLYFVAVDVIFIFWLNWWAGSNRQLDR